MTSEIRTNTLTSRAGLSTVTLTDSGPMFSGITTFVDNSGFNFGVGTGSSIFTPASNTLTFGTNSKERVRVDSNGRLLLGTVRTYGTGPYYDDICINNSDGSGSAGGAGIDLISKSDNFGAIVFSNESQHERGYIKFEHNSGVNKLRFGTLGTDRWQIYGGGNLQPAADSAYDIGSSSVRVRNVYADTLYGDGSNLTGISGGGVTLSGSTNNTVCTVTGANAIQGESTLTYDGNKLKFGGGTRALDNGYYDDIVIDNSDNSSGDAGGSGISLISGTSSWCGLIFGDNDEHQRAYVKYSNDSDYMQIHAPSTGYIRFDTGSERLRITSTGKIGLGVVPSAWDTTTTSKVLQVGRACIFDYNNDYFHVGHNFYWDGSNYKYIANDSASRLLQNDGQFTFYQAASGTANNNITWNQRLRITSSGDYGFNDDSPTAHASGNNTVLSIKGKGSSYSGKIDFKDSSGNIDSYINSDNSVLQFYCDPNSQNGNTAMMFYVHGGERVRINASGNMSLGGIDPVPTSTSYNTASFHIHQQTNNSGYGAQIHLTTANKGSGSAAGTQLSQYNGSLYINNQDDQFMYFYNNDNSAHRLAIRNDGTVCFGNQTSNTLYANGSGSTWYDQKDSWQMAQSGDLGWSCWYMNKIGGSDNRLIQFNSSGSAIGYINRSGSNVVYQTSSDYRLKKDDVEISDGIERVKKLRPIKFKWKETNEESEGFFAHEAQEICPYAVSGHKDEVATTDHGDRKKGDMIIQAVDYGEFTPLLSAALKELIAKVETLENKVNDLETELNNHVGHLSPP